MAQILRKISDLVNGVAEWALLASLTVMTMAILLQILFRYVIKSSLPWSEELGRYLLVWSSFLGASIAVKREAHVGVAFIYSLIGGMIGSVLRAITLLLIAGFSLMMVYLLLSRHRDNRSYADSGIMPISPPPTQNRFMWRASWPG